MNLTPANYPYLELDPWNGVMIYSYEVNEVLNIWTPETWEPGSEEEEERRWRALKRIDEVARWVHQAREAEAKRIRQRRRIREIFNCFCPCMRASSI
jgi:hypothetical protein